MSFVEDVQNKIVNIQDMVVGDHTLQFQEDFNWNYDLYNNILVAGGRGKTSFLYSVVAGLIRTGAVVDVAQLGSVDWVPLSYSSSLKYRVFYSQDRILRALRRFHLEMQVRLNELRKLNVENKRIDGTYFDYGMKPHFFVIDEWTSFMNFGGQKFVSEFMRYITDIVLLGRSAGFQVVIGASDPKANVLPTVIKQQINFRVVLGYRPDYFYNMVFGFVPDVLEDVEFNDALLDENYGLGIAYMNKPVAFRVPEIPDNFDIYKYFDDLGGKYPADRAPGIRELDSLLND